MSWACLSHAYSSRGSAFPLLLPPEINEIARRYDRYGRANGPASGIARLGFRNSRVRSLAPVTTSDVPRKEDRDRRVSLEPTAGEM